MPKSGDVAMIKTILVPATGSDADAAVFASAHAVARAFAAHLDFLHVRPDATAVAVAMASESAGAMIGGIIERIEQESEQRETRAKQMFEGFCRGAGLPLAETPTGTAAPSAQWHREVGAEPDWIADYGRAADLAVIGRPADGEGAPIETLEAALLQTGRPLLIPPAAGFAALPDKVAIAWKSTREAARTVGAAMPFLMAAKTVEILTVEEAEPAPPSAADERLLTSLAWHGFRVSGRRLRPGAGGAVATLLAAAGEQPALLVMGGYGHSRLREWIFGGFTETVLRAAPMPVLMAH